MAKLGPRSKEFAQVGNAGSGGIAVGSAPVTRVPGSTQPTEQPIPSIPEARATHAKLVEEK